MMRPFRWSASLPLAGALLAIPAVAYADAAPSPELFGLIVGAPIVCCVLFVVVLASAIGLWMVARKRKAAAAQSAPVPGDMPPAPPAPSAPTTPSTDEE